MPAPTQLKALALSLVSPENPFICEIYSTELTKIAAGDTVTVEMHQHDSRACTEEAIGGAHHGPVMVYLSKVADAAAADGSDPFFKIFESGYDAATEKWGNDVLNDNCGKQDVTIPADIEAGDYILRAETIALHAAGSEGGAQPYVTCYQITVTGGGSSAPEGVLFPGAYSPTDPGILINIYSDFGTYVIPGPEVYESGSADDTPASSAVASSVATPTTSTAVSSAAPTTSGFTTSVAAVATSAPVVSASATTSAVGAEETFTLETFIAWLQEKASA